jgi:hypothetical protein
VRWLIIAGIVILASYLGDIVYNRLWWDHAEAAIHETVSAAARGQSPKGIVASVDTAARTSDFALPYDIVGVDNELGGSSLIDLMSPGVYVAILHFTNGREYDVEAARGEDGVWHATIALRR